MSRRLEYISTGFEDYSKGMEAFNASYAQGKKIQWEEEDRQRRLQEQEDSRLAMGQQIYMHGMADIEKMGDGLTTEEKKPFIEGFDKIRSMYVGLQEQIAKGVKPGTPQYLQLQDDIYKAQRSLGDSINNLKVIKDAQKSVLVNMKNGLEVDKGVINNIDLQRKAILGGTYVPSIGLVTPETVQMNSYKPAYATIKQFSAIMPTITDYTESVNPQTGKKEATSRIVPSFSGSYVSAANILANTAPNDTRDITNNLNEWKDKDPTNSPQYKYYLAWMDNNKVKEDSQYQPPKSPEDFNEADFMVMNALSTKYKPSDKELVKLLPQTHQKAMEKENLTNAIMKDLYSGDSTLVKKRIDEIKGSLQAKGWNINMNGNKVSFQKAKDEYSEGISGSFDISKNAVDKATALSFINSYLTSIGKGGTNYMLRNK